MGSDFRVKGTYWTETLLSGEQYFNIQSELHGSKEMTVGEKGRMESGVIMKSENWYEEASCTWGNGLNSN